MNFKVGQTYKYRATGHSGGRHGELVVITKIGDGNKARMIWGTFPDGSPGWFLPQELVEVPSKSPAEHILAKLIEAKRKQAETNAAYGRARVAAEEATMRVSILQGKLDAAIRTEAEKK